MLLKLIPYLKLTSLIKKIIHEFNLRVKSKPKTFIHIIDEQVYLTFYLSRMITRNVMCPTQVTN